MAKPYKVKAFSVSTDEDLSELEIFLSSVKSVDHMVHYDGKILVVYEE